MTSKTTTLIYSSEKYEKYEKSEKFQFTVKCNESFIKISIEKEENFDGSFYNIEYKT